MSVGKLTFTIKEVIAVCATLLALVGGYYKLSSEIDLMKYDIEMLRGAVIEAGKADTPFDELLNELRIMSLRLELIPTPTPVR